MLGFKAFADHADRLSGGSSRSLRRGLIALALLLAAQGSTAYGQLTWTGVNDSTWNTAGNWSGFQSSWTATTGVFNSTAAADRRSITITGTQGINKMTVSADGYSFNGGVFQLSDYFADFTFDNSTTISSGISSNQYYFKKQGAGTLTLAGTVSLTSAVEGYINVAAGTLRQTAGTITLGRNGTNGSAALFIGNGGAGLGPGEFIAEGGTLRTTGSGGGASLDVGTVNNSQLTVNGGSLGFGGSLNRIGRGSGVSGTISLQSGELALNNLSKGLGTATFTFSAGTLRPFNANTTFGSTISGSNFTITLSSTGATILGLDQASNTARTVDIYTPLAGTGGITFSGGLINIRGSNSYAGLTTVAAGGTAAFFNTSASSSGFTVNGMLDLTGIGSFKTTGTSQAVSGAGTIAVGSGTLSILGSLMPGNSPGTLSIDGDLLLGANSLTTMEIDGLTSGLYDIVRGIGIGTESITYGGTLSLAFGPTGGSTPGTIKLFEFDSYFGDFQTVQTTGLASGYSASFNAATGEVVIVPEPGTLALLIGLGSVLPATMRRRRAS